MKNLFSFSPALRWLSAVAVSSASFTSFAAEPNSALLERAHAHNDYEHRRPLLDALDNGFCSVEADIYLVEGKLLVAHDRINVSRERTLEGLYLDPLRQRVRQNGGRVFVGGPAFTLLIDIKSDADATYSVLRNVLKNYADMLTSFSTESTRTNAVTVILSGNRPRQMLKSESLRYAAFDGRLDDLKGTEPSSFIPLVSDNWGNIFKWRGTGSFPAPEKEQLRQIVEKAHAQGRRIRFWGAPDSLPVWKELFAGEVDLINTDDLAGLRRFLVSPAP